jgi:hypothetical protein
MKAFWLGCCFFLGVSAAGAQSFGDWWKQSSTKLKNDAEEIAEWAVYLKDLEKGYSIVENGLHTIGAIKKGEFDLHNAFYTSLEQINPTVGKLGEVVEIISLQAAIIERFSGSMSRYRQSASLGSNEVAFISQVYQTVLSDAQTDVTMLIQILTAGKLQMTDDQRMGRLRDLDSEMRARYEFTAGFTNQADLLSMQRVQGVSDVGTLQGLYGIP